LRDRAAVALDVAQHLADDPVRDGLRLAARRLHRLLVEVGQRAVGHEDARVVVAEPVVADETLAPLRGELGDRARQSCDEFARDLKSDKVRLGEIPVVMDLFLRALQERPLAFWTPTDGDLPSSRADLAALLPVTPEAIGLVGDGLADRLIAVEVLDLALRRPAGLAALGEADRHVHVEPARAFLEAHLAHAGADDDLAQSGRVRDRLVRGAHVWLRDDLEERHARAVEVDERVSVTVLCVRGVLFEMRAMDADALRTGRGRDLDPAFHAEREVVLRDLIPLRQVGVHVVLAVELRVRGNTAVEREAGGDRELDRATVRYWQGTWKPEAHGAHERVRGRAEPLRAARAEHLRARRELDVRLDA